MKFLIVFSAILVICSAQNLLSVNPVGYAFFNPAAVREITLDGPSVSSVLQNNTDGYFDYYAVWVPANVSSFVVNVNSTDANCGTYLYIFYSFYDTQIVGYPCQNTDGNDFCGYSGSFYANPSNQYSLYCYRPNNYVYFQVTENSWGYTCPYTFSVTTAAYCTESSAIWYSTPEAPCSKYTQIQNGQTVSQYYNGTIATFLIDVPKNTTKVRAALVSNVSAWDFAMNTGYAEEPLGGWYNYGQNATDNLWYYYAEINWPLYGRNFITIGSENYGVFNLTVTWDECKGCLTVPSPPFPSTLPSSYTFPSMNATNPGNSYTGYFFELTWPAGVSGYLNITCNVTTGDLEAGTIVIFNFGTSMINCDYYYNYLYCDPGYNANYRLVLSQQLYPGNTINAAVCTQAANPVTVSLEFDGALSVPSPAPTASASVSPTGEDSSSASRELACMMVVLLTMLVSL